MEIFANLSMSFFQFSLICLVVVSLLAFGLWLLQPVVLGLSYLIIIIGNILVFLYVCFEFISYGIMMLLSKFLPIAPPKKRDQF